MDDKELMSFSKLKGLEKGKKPDHTPCFWSIRFIELGRDEKKNQTFHAAKCKSVNPSGIKITSIIPLTPKRFVLVDLDLRLLETTVAIKNILTLSGQYILTEVVGRHLNLETGLFEAELEFIDAARTEEFDHVLKQIPE